MDYDSLEPIEVAPNVFWVGFFDAGSAFHSNPYVLIDGDEAIIFDPAGAPDYPSVASKIFSLVDVQQVSYIIAHHQDPDLCAGIPLLERTISNPGLQIVTHSRASLLIRYYGVKSEFYNVDQHEYTLTLKSGRTLKFLIAPFCHFPAAIVTYDAQAKLLFSGDLFGGISTDWQLFATEDYEQHMAPFHIGYMASQRHLSQVMERIETLDLDLILPQHGSIIRRERIRDCIASLKKLRCGIDAEVSEEELYGWIPR